MSQNDATPTHYRRIEQLYNTLDAEFPNDELPDDRAEAARDVLRNTAKPDDLVVTALKLLALTPDGEEFWGVALYYADQQSDGITKVVDV